MPDEKWVQQTEVQQALEELAEAGSIFRTAADGSWHSVSRRPHRGVDLRSIGESYAIFLEDGKTLVGSSSGMRAFTECHEGAVYLHRAKQYLVTKLDLERRNALVRPANIQYYTRALSEKDTKILGTPLRRKEFPGFIVREARLKVTERVVAYEKRRTSSQERIGIVDLDLPPVHFETVGIWIEIPDEVKGLIQKMGLHFMGGIHAMEHAAISVFPLFALCDRDDIGGISTPEHEQVCRAAVFIYDGHAGGVGLAHRAFDVIEDLLEKTRLLVEKCPCEDGCPSCIHSPKCGSGNQPLDKKACLTVLEFLLSPEKMQSVPTIERSSDKLIFPDLTVTTQQGVRKKPEKKSTTPAIRRNENQENNSVTGSREAQSLRAPLETTQVRNAGSLSSDEHMSPSPQPSPGGRGGRSESSVPLVEEAKASPLSHKERDMVRGSRLNASPHESKALETESRRLPRPKKRVVVFDLETQKLAHEVGGWKNISAMRMSVGVTYSDDEGFLTFTEDNVSGLISILQGADLVVGFNQLRFDYEVLRAYSSENLRGLPNLDICREVGAALGHRVNLDHLARFTLNSQKKGHGIDAASWFREGRMDLLEEYCRQDVKITRDLYTFGLTKGFLFYQRKDLTKARVYICWQDLPQATSKSS